MPDCIQKQKKVDTNEKIKVVTSNNLIKAAGLEHTSLKARKLLYIAISQCRIIDNNFFEYKISVPDFAKLMGIAPSNVYSEIDKITDELMRGFIKYIPDGESNFTKFQLFSQCIYKENEGIVFKLSEEMTPVLLDLKEDFSQPLLKDFLKMNSNYSIEIWHYMQMLMKSKKPGIRRMDFYISLQELRSITGTTNKYPKIGMWKSRILDKAIKEIKDNCAVEISYEFKKEGHMVTGFYFTATSILGIDITDYTPSSKTIEKCHKIESEQYFTDNFNESYMSEYAVYD